MDGSKLENLKKVSTVSLVGQTVESRVSRLQEELPNDEHKKTKEHLVAK